MVSKLTEAQATEIDRRYRAGGISMKRLGGKYNVTAQTVHNIVHRARWKHLPSVSE